VWVILRVAKVGQFKRKSCGKENISAVVRALRLIVTSLLFGISIDISLGLQGLGSLRVKIFLFLFATTKLFVYI
jgi:hypothetical protein